MIPIPLVAFLLAGGLSQGDVPDSTPAAGKVILGNTPIEGQCTPEQEGEWMGCCLGIRSKVPFTGTLGRRDPVGRKFPAVRASISIDDVPCPKPHVLRLDPSGGFSEDYVLFSNGPSYCRGGKRMCEEWVTPVRLRITSPGCDDLLISFAGEKSAHTLELSCTEGVDISEPLTTTVPEDRIGARVELRRNSLRIDGERIDLPVDVPRLERVLGPATVVPAHGDQYSDDVYEWERSGVSGYSRPNTARIHGLTFVLDPDLNSRHWCNAGTVRLTVDRVPITRASPPSQILKTRFREVNGQFKSHAKGTYALLSVAWSRGFYELDISPE